jgi:hypothetical protein
MKPSAMIGAICEEGGSLILDSIVIATLPQLKVIPNTPSVHPLHVVCGYYLHMV